MQNSRQTIFVGLAIILFFQLFVEFIYFILGVRMDIFPLIGYWQFIDPLLLKTDLLRSILYLHIQPPGLNLMVGIVLKLFPLAYPFVFQIIYLLLGILALWSLFILQTRFGISRYLAMVTTLLFGASPGYVLFEHHLLYTFPVAALWLISVLLLHNYLISKRFFWLIAFFTVLWVLAWTRAVVHLIYIAAVLGMLLWKVRPVTRKHIIAGVVLLVLVSLPYVKNQIIFGKFTQSTWFPGNLSKVIIFPIPFKQRVQMYKNHQISRYSAYIWQPAHKGPSDSDESFDSHIDERGNPFWSSDEFLKPYKNLPHIPVLYSRFKSTKALGDQQPNVNYIGLIGSYNKVMQDDIKLALKYPYIVLTSWLYSFFIYYQPSYIQLYISKENVKSLKPIISLYETFYGRIDAGFMHNIGVWLRNNLHYEPFVNPKHVYLTLLFGLPFVLFWGIRTYRSMPDSPDKWTLLYLLFTVIFVMLVGNLMDCGENNRFRFLTDFMYVFLTGLAIQWLIDRFIKRKRA